MNNNDPTFSKRDSIRNRIVYDLIDKEIVLRWTNDAGTRENYVYFSPETRVWYYFYPCDDLETSFGGIGAEALSGGHVVSFGVGTYFMELGFFIEAFRRMTRNWSEYKLKVECAEPYALYLAYCEMNEELKTFVPRIPKAVVIPVLV